MKKVLITATVQSHIVQFHKPLVEMLHEHGYEVHVAARNNLAEKNGLKLDFVDKIYNLPFARSPKSLDNLKAYRRLKRILKQEHYDFVHCNTPMGGIVSRLAATSTRKRGSRVIYTAHGFHFYKGAPLINWLILYPIEKVMASFCDTLITISKEDYRLAKRKFHTNVEHIHGVGVNSNRYHPVSIQEQLNLRRAEKLKAEDFVILCTGELKKNKNQRVLISAAVRLKHQIPNLVVLLAGNGPTEVELKRQIRNLGVDDQVRLLGYRTDLESILPAVDLVVACSYREGMPLNIIEAMLCKKPIVASRNRGHKELVKNGYNGYIVAADNVDSYVEYISDLYKNPGKREGFGLYGYKKAQAYDAENVKKELELIYEYSSRSLVER